MFLSYIIFQTLHSQFKKDWYPSLDNPEDINMTSSG